MGGDDWPLAHKAARTYGMRADARLTLAKRMSEDAHHDLLGRPRKLSTGVLTRCSIYVT